MKRARENETCSICSQSDSTTFCSCTEPPIQLCESCVGSHLSKERIKIHELSPIEIRDFISVPGYKENLRRRQKVQEEAVGKIRDNLREIGEWKVKMIQEADYFVAQIVEFRASVVKEMDELLEEVSLNIETGIAEFKEKFYEAQPHLISPIAVALWNYESGKSSLLSCQTDFAVVRKTFEECLFSVDIYLQTELANYEPQRLIKKLEDIRVERKVNVYQKLTEDFTIPINKRTKNKLQVFSQRFPSFVVKRGPIITEEGLYFGEWNSLNEQHGFGKFHSHSDDTYIGEFCNSMYHGQGVYVYSSEDVTKIIPELNEMTRKEIYIGEFRKNKYYGFGYYEFANTTDGIFSYIGEFRKGTFEGLGINLGESGPIYAGGFKNNAGHGNGLLYRNGKASYESFIDGIKQ